VLSLPLGSEEVAYFSCDYFQKFNKTNDQGTPMSQTDRRTTSRNNTAICVASRSKNKNIIFINVVYM